MRGGSGEGRVVRGGSGEGRGVVRGIKITRAHMYL